MPLRNIAAICCAWLCACASAPQPEAAPQDDMPLPISTAPPHYSPAACAAKATGTLLLEFPVLPDGRVGVIRVIGAQPRGLFEFTAVTAVHDWRYAPRPQATMVERRLDLDASACADQAEAAAGNPPPVPPRGRPEWPPDYLSSVHSRIAQYVRYPRKSQLNAEQGEARVRIIMDRSGTILGTWLSRKSGFQALDSEALGAIARIEAFAPVPPDLFPEARVFEIDEPINFSLK